MELYSQSKHSLLLCCAYRPPSKMDFYEYFAIECEKGFSYTQKVLIVGDLNSNILSSKLPELKILCSFMNAFGLCKMFNEPTCSTESTSSHLDVFLPNGSFSFDKVFALPVGFSDHHIAMGTYLARRSHQPCTHRVIYARSNRKFDSALLFRGPPCTGLAFCVPFKLIT